MKYWLIYIFLLVIGCSFGQNDAILASAEYRLSIKLNALRAAKDADEVAMRNNELKRELESTFKIDGVFDYPFSSLKSIGTIKSDDNMVRMFNWNVEHSDFTHDYFCYILYKNVKKKRIEVTELIDNSDMLPARPTETLTADNWYGALYYSIIGKKRKGKIYYTLLGWDGNTASSNIKLMDVLYFTGSKPKLGYGLFKNEEGVHKRLFFEHKEQAVMTMRLEADRNMIIYDHLSPESPALKGFYAYYVPDMSYDAYEYVNDFWQHRSDVISVNKDGDKKKMTIYTYNAQKGQPESRTVRNTWINPTDDKAPVKNGSHKAVLPDAEKTVEQPKAKPTNPAVKHNNKIKQQSRGKQPYSILQGGQ
jgi:hypothetical protein